MLHNTAKISYNTPKGKGGGFFDNKNIRDIRLRDDCAAWQYVLLFLLSKKPPPAQSYNGEAGGGGEASRMRSRTSKQWLAKKHVQHDELSYLW